MIERLKNINFFGENSFTVLGIVLGEITTYNVLWVERNNDHLSIVKTESFIGFENFKHSIKDNKPLLVNFTGKGIINKKVPSGKNYIKQVLFNVSVDDFYVFTFFEEVNNFVSIGRKTIIDEQFEILKGSGFKPVDFSLGPFVGAICRDLLNKNRIVVSDFVLEFNDNVLIDFFNSEDETIAYKIGEEILLNRDVILFATLLNYIYPNHKIDYDREFLNQNSKDLKLKKVFESVLVGGLSFFLLALLGSYALLHYFNNEYVTYEQQLYHFNDNYDQIKKMEESLQQKQFIALNSGVLSANFLSFYIKEIGRSTPVEIILNNLAVNPVIKKIKTNEEIDVEFKTILIEGNAKESKYVNNWVKELKKFNWVSKIEILKLNSNKDSNDSFTLKIIVP